MCKKRGEEYKKVSCFLEITESKCFYRANVHFRRKVCFYVRNLSYKNDIAWSFGNVGQEFLQFHGTMLLSCLYGGAS